MVISKAQFYAIVTMRRDLKAEQKSLKQSLKLFVANVGLSQLKW